MKYFANAAGGLASIDAGGVANRYTVAHGWVTADDLTPQSLASIGLVGSVRPRPGSWRV